MDRFTCGFEIKFSKDAPPGMFSGYGAVFNNIDSYGDTIAPGAFTETLKAWGAKGKLPKMLCQHGGWGMSADDLLPVGNYSSMKEDSKGLYCEGQLICLDTERGKYLYEGMKSGAIDGLSIGYQPVDFTIGTKDGEPRRTLNKVNLFEVSPVTFPANEMALVDNIKALDNIKTLSDAERFLRDAAHLSRKEALALVSRVKAIAQREAAAGGDIDGLLKSFKGANSVFAR